MERKHILLVEDNPDDELLTLRAINKLGLPIDVAVIRDGAAALAFLEATAQANLPDLLLLDLKLPKVNGLEVLRRVRSLDVSSVLPVVVFTSSNEEQDISQAYTLGGNSYIRKPVDFHQFSGAVLQICHYWFQLNTPPPKFSSPVSSPTP
jgi:two-component system, response regulator